jgi:alpha-L-fucosidase
MNIDRRQFLAVAAASTAAEYASRTAFAEVESDVPTLAKPTPSQQSWQDMELGMFIHFGMSICAQGKPSGTNGLPDPSVYNPRDLDTDQWLEAAKAMGAKYAVFTARHGSGFMQWPSDAYPYSVKQSPWRGGKGDAVQSFVDSCHKYGIRPGLYACVHYNAYWRVYGQGRVQSGDPETQKQYSRSCEKMLGELWQRYGDLAEIWFDGGALPVSQGGPDIVPLAERLQPRAMYFQGPASTIRWVGNESGVAGYPCWATVPDRESVMNDKNIMAHGDPNGNMWLPGECDVPMPGHGWGWSPDQRTDIQPLPSLMDMYYRSVGHNCNLLLNATPNADGRIPDANLPHYEAFGNEIKRRFGNPLATTSGQGTTIELPLKESTPIDHVMIAEEISQGERIRGYRVEGLDATGVWQTLCEGVSVGHKRIVKFDSKRIDRVRLQLTKSAASPLVRELSVYYVG